jgi:hypothetical protein
MAQDKHSYERAITSLPYEEKLEFDQQETAQPQGGFESPRQLGKSALTLSKEKREKEQNIYDDAIEMGLDFLEATGGHNLEPQHYAALQQAGLTEYGIEDVLKVFHEDWAILQGDILEEQEIRQIEAQAEKKRILKEIEEAQENGKLPPNLFLKIERAISPHLPRKRKRKRKDGSVIWLVDYDKGLFTDTEVDDEDKITRYAKFVVAQNLLAGVNASQTKLQSIALGYNYQNENDKEGILSHSYTYELNQASSSPLSEEQIELATPPELFPYIFKEYRKSHLKQILDISSCTKQEVTQQQAKVEELPIPKHYFDPKTGSVVEEQFYGMITESQKWDNLFDEARELGELLREHNPLPNGPRRPEGYHQGFVKPNIRNWSKERYTRYASWIHAVVPPPIHPKERPINEKIIYRARNLGLGPSRSQVARIFGTVGNLYLEAGIAGANIKNNFNSLTIQDIAKHLRYVSEINNGRRPTMEDIDKLAHEDPNNPSHEYIYKRTQKIGGLRHLHEMNGFFITELADNDDMLRWGIKFMKANDGALPSQQALNFLATQQLGPSDTTIRRADKFGSLANFNQELLAAYEADEVNTKLIEEEKINKIQNSIVANPEIATLIDSCSTNDEAIERFAKYQVVDAYAPFWPSETKIVISTEGINGKNFTESIRLLDENLASEKIESLALELGVYDDIWRQDIKKLRLGDKYKAFMDKRNKKRRAAQAKKPTSKAEVSN